MEAVDLQELKRLDAATDDSKSLIQSLLSYCPASGLFTNRKTGRVIGSLNWDGYVGFRVGGKSYRAHRLAFLFMRGDLPPQNMDVDHINGNRADNRFENLRIASRAENMANAPLFKANTSGYKGVTFHSVMNKWSAEINIGGRKKRIGFFDDIHYAAHAYNKAAIQYQGEFARLNVPGTPANSLAQVKEQGK